MIYVTPFRESFLSASSEKTFFRRDRVREGVVLVILSGRLLRGESEGKKVGSLLSVAPDTPAEGRVVDGDKASGLVGGDCGKSPTRELSLANG
jgi:hypothetical protein